MLGPPPVKVGFFIINRTSFYFVSFFYIKIIPVGRTAGGVLHKIFRGKKKKNKPGRYPNIHGEKEGNEIFRIEGNQTKRKKKTMAIDLSNRIEEKKR